MNNIKQLKENYSEKDGIPVFNEKRYVITGYVKDYRNINDNLTSFIIYDDTDEIEVIIINKLFIDLEYYFLNKFIENAIKDNIQITISGMLYKFIIMYAVLVYSDLMNELVYITEQPGTKQ